MMPAELTHSARQVGVSVASSPPPGTPSDLAGRRRLVAPVADGRL